MSSVLVTGCNGFVGSHLCQRLHEDGHTVSGLDRDLYRWKDGFPSLMKAGRVNFFTGDITDFNFVAGVVASVKPRVVIHLASVVGVSSYIADPLRVIEVNILGLGNLLKALRGSGCRVVFSSTSEIYGKNPIVPWREDADRVIGPTSIDRWSYSTSKGAAEHMLWACSQAYEIEAVVLRYFNLYGPRQRPDLLIPAQIQRALTGREMLLYDGGRQTRCFTFIEDAVAGTIAAAFSKSAGGLAFNIGSSVETTVEEATRIVGEIAGNGQYKIKNVLTGELYGKAYEDIPRRVPEVERAATLLGWSAQTLLMDGVFKTVEWWKKILLDAGYDLC